MKEQQEDEEEVEREGKKVDEGGKNVGVKMSSKRWL